MNKIELFSKKHPHLKTLADHEEGSIEEMVKTLKEFDIEVIVEFGTWMGGVTLRLHEAFPTVDLYTFDKDNLENAFNYRGKIEKDIPLDALMEFKEKCFNEKVRFIRANIVVDGGFEMVNMLCKAPFRKFLYCDNGKKPFEVKQYGSVLNPGDVLGVHDFPHQVNFDNTDFSEFEELPFNEVATREGWQTRLFIKK